MLQCLDRVSVQSCLVKCSEIDLASEMKERERDESEFCHLPCKRSAVLRSDDDDRKLIEIDC